MLVAFAAVDYMRNSYRFVNWCTSPDASSRPKPERPCRTTRTSVSQTRNLAIAGAAARPGPSSLLQM